MHGCVCLYVALSMNEYHIIIIETHALHPLMLQGEQTIMSALLRGRQFNSDSFFSVCKIDETLQLHCHNYLYVLRKLLSNV